ncbi:MAG: 23S rRNA (guanosine(2251)-2'-O)-methyltransferase RlmB, partial [bacterium]
MKEKAKSRLGRKEPGREAGLLRIYGRRPVLMALQKRAVRRLWVAQQARGDSIQRIVRLSSEQKIEVLPLDMEHLGKEAEAVHQGVMAEVVPPAVRRDLEAFVDEVTTENPWALLLILDGIEDPQNFGAVLRAAECAGVHGLIISGRRRAPLSAAVVKASAGALFSLELVEVPNLHQAVRFLKENGLWVVAATGEGEIAYSDFDWRRPVALIMGAEGRGVSPLLKKTADVRIRIPLSGTVESLNVSVATGVLLFECLRQRSKGANG